MSDAQREMYPEEILLVESVRGAGMTAEDAYRLVPVMTKFIEKRDGALRYAKRELENVRRALEDVCEEIPLEVILTHPNELIREIGKTWHDRLEQFNITDEFKEAVAKARQGKTLREMKNILAAEVKALKGVSR